ncbi:FKBP-type peptidyl-prolyl cis-trans isomerase [Buchnera aphidicola]|uniref:Peptidyl-prolyl cis-trans isomerase n=1 Tax=Buchnera aphidicola subsp. Tuberolachnus salignus TaxID=98804 RepID=A0A160SX23_BUCTT|nr:FKBP-type peptidyl-prolyl cis-trans isomerase [Buchnera aphidicola]CUR53330.1 FKBP-type peptidyl-prolyl cis-trans isomerase FkpA [Buchnera aphidicola (Tuberolachnus salignus)]
MFYFLKILSSLYLILSINSFAYASSMPLIKKNNFVKSTFEQAIITNEDKMLYSVGVSFGKMILDFVNNSTNKNIIHDPMLLYVGLWDALSKTTKLPKTEINKYLHVFSDRVSQTNKELENLLFNKISKLDSEFLEKFSQEEDVEKSSLGTLYKIKNLGTGEYVQDDSTILVHYKGSLVDGTEFDNSYKTGVPIKFILNQTIPTWRESLKLLKKGGKILLVIPSDITQKMSKIPGIPHSSTLIFEIEVLDIL